MVGSIFLNRASHRAMMRLWHLVVFPRLSPTTFFPSWLQLGNSLGAGVGAAQPHWRVPGPAACRDGCPPRCHPPLADARWCCCIGGVFESLLVSPSPASASVLVRCLPISPLPSRESTPVTFDPPSHLSFNLQPPLPKQQAQQASRTQARPKESRNVAAPNIGRGRLVAAWCAVICGHRQGRGPAWSWRANAIWGAGVRLSRRRRRSPRRG